ncbi:hypothetical protein [Pseudooceanicola sp. HF7]|uniref:hypothetical protein n=1 Tax=Pseudooceanicola sp. HF7 TaxID=2721560 RepID=UPI0014304915|nr:hypothetical protein [Pseudooceanicola sp. HF7]NIZ08985.1 hypothetical protein [Pseudooceanicola sp. HF7]
MHSSLGDNHRVLPLPPSAGRDFFGLRHGWPRPITPLARERAVSLALDFAQKVQALLAEIAAMTPG